MNFIVTEMTFLKYFYPMIIECIKRGIIPRIHLRKNGKYNNPCSPQAIRCLSNIFRDYIDDVEVRVIDEKIDNDLPVVTVEGCGIQHANENSSKYALIYQTDFVSLMESYQDSCTNIFFTSKKYAEHYDCINDKNVYLGTPKFDILPSKNDVIKKFGLDENQKYAFVLYPRKRDLNSHKLRKIYEGIRDAGYKIIVKTRGKDPVQNSFERGDLYLEDGEWYPHPSLEALIVSDVLINFDSTGIEEAVYLNTPVLNFKSKPFTPMIPFLYEYDYCIDIPKDIDLEEVRKTTFDSINQLVEKDHKASFEKSQMENLYAPSPVSHKILDFILKN